MSKEKQLKMTMIGTTSELHINDIGSPYLHRRHRVGFAKIGETKIGRAVVYDQHIIDSLFLDNELDAQQHNSLNKYLEIIVKAGTFPTGVDAEKFCLDKIFSHAAPRATVLVRIQRHLKEVLTNDHEKVLWRVMTNNPDKLERIEVGVIRQSSDALMEFWGLSQDSVSLFQQALLNPSAR